MCRFAVAAPMMLGVAAATGLVGRADAQLFSSNSGKRKNSVLNNSKHGHSPLNTGVSPYAKKPYKKPSHHYLKRLLSWF